MLTLEEYNKLPVGQHFRIGLSTNSLSGIYMINNDIDKILVWVAKKRIEGWCIYTHWLDSEIEYAKVRGDKVTSKENIKKLVPCDDEVFKLYVY